ncbi:Hachiman antiphage defense system protein HamA [Alistipes indistinctus]|jgi:hypothetical protein|uniref:Hachiman antiphage defense system protein HamA n=1 Tax=Alistipes indistinctus TaxID=626932 RepID=UPI0015F1E266|nr:Hachiman antiphage defense system protein HamA [Alistipes indistinctus]BCG55100.1 hypothetical protein AI2BBH_21460 [Alistipes indistinctus]
MRQSLVDFINNVIIFEYSLPNNTVDIPKTILSSHDDHCYRLSEDGDIADVIYHAIIDYAWEEHKIRSEDHQNLLAAAFDRKIRYQEEDSEKTQLKYGFYGEVLLCAILYAKYGARAIISKGTLYQPNAKRECPGYDAYHIIETANSMDLWFGEVKFHMNYTGAINSALKENGSFKLPSVLSAEYLQSEFYTIANRVSNVNDTSSRICQFLTDVECRPFNIVEEAQRYNMKLVYPIFLIYDHDNKSYDENIKKVVDYISSNYSATTISLGIDLSLFFILLPVKNTRNIKTTVLQWIREKKQLVL